MEYPIPPLQTETWTTSKPSVLALIPQLLFVLQGELVVLTKLVFVTASVFSPQTSLVNISSLKCSLSLETFLHGPLVPGGN